MPDRSLRESARSIDQQLSVLEREIARLIELPTTPPDIRERLVARLASLKARAAQTVSGTGS